jgi:Ca2+-binding RTX toxin-like protein
VRLPPSAVERLSGNAKSNTLYAPDSGGKVLGKDGGDILIGGNRADRLSGGAGDDNVIGGPGRDVLRGGPGSDTLQDTQGPTTVRTGGAKHGLDTVYVRDGHGHDTVHCTTRNSAVVADRGDRVTGPCGSVTRSGPIDRPPL